MSEHSFVVVEKSLLRDLNAEVTKLLNVGWKLAGNFTVSPDSRIYYQPMVLKVKDKTKDNSFLNGDD